MTFHELHASIRSIVQAAGLQQFTLNMRLFEMHQGRVDVTWSIFVSREEQNLRNLLFTTNEVPILLDFLRLQLPTKVPPVRDLELGPLPHSEYPHDEATP